VRNPWWGANDVCYILNVIDMPQALAKLKDYEKNVGNTYTRGGIQEMSKVNESGLYKVGIQIRKLAPILALSRPYRGAIIYVLSSNMSLCSLYYINYIYVYSCIR